MRVLIATYPEKTHFYLMVPLAWALRTAGHEVRVATSPKLVDIVGTSGLTAVPVGTDADWTARTADPDDQPWPIDQTAAAMTDPQELSYERLHDFFANASRHFFPMINDPLFDGMVAYARQWQPDLVIWEHFTYAGLVAAKAVGAADARLVCGADVLTRARQRLLEIRPDDSDPFGEWLGARLEPYGVRFTEEAFVGQTTIDQSPASMRLPVANVPTIPVQYVPYNGPAVIPDWLREPPARPRVLVTAGVTMRDLAGHDMIPADILAGFADEDVEVVATLIGPKDAPKPEVPDNVRLVDFVPFQALLPTCSAIVHAGGAGSTHTAMAYGVPQLSLGWLWDASTRARLIRDLGAGLLLQPFELNPQALRDNVMRLVNEPSFKAAAERLRQEALADPTPNEAVPLLEKLAADR